MRHGKSFNHLGRTSSHRNAMLSNMASSLILHKRITTTVAKAKALRQYVEPLLTKSKNDTTHSRRLVFSTLGNKEVLKELFDNVSAKIAGRPGGYTRIIKLSQTRLGDNADMCIIELVDFNDTMLEAKNAGEAKATTRRSRRSTGKKADTEAAAGEGDSSAEVVAEEKPAKKAKAAATEVSAPEDTATETLKDGETREEKAAE
ncbi:50S ribosomal protein L17 [Hymenobacter rubripertinctus]|uniref:Large ribosomal subunit protein bL17 n=1 Tax=Hymenobacter rubripertinctus TaxID=2029981 RepID=A0A418RA80_9BACT|nr:50S ribosomal protein L17 [Hymenobacter rubripertinctus]RIY14185.1 50S ribosomal protein L17 [Hymenobacter rubripertinctus]